MTRPIALGGRVPQSSPPLREISEGSKPLVLRILLAASSGGGTEQHAVGGAQDSFGEAAGFQGKEQKGRQKRWPKPWRPDGLHENVGADASPALPAAPSGTGEPGPPGPWKPCGAPGSGLWCGTAGTP
jgi:hypothetical protein